MRQRVSFKFNFSPKDPAPKLTQSINDCQSDTKNWKGKRLEEQYKLVFKRGFKRIFDTFKTRNNLVYKKHEAEKQFYESYFQESFERLGIKFSYSKQRRNKSSTAVPLFNPRTINASYVESVLSSAKFEKEFEDYVDNIFVREYTRTRESKICRIAEKCLQFFIEYPERGEEMVRDYVVKNKKCKLPWTNRELFQAVGSVKSAIMDKGKASHNNSTSVEENRGNLKNSLEDLDFQKLNKIKKKQIA